MLPLPSLILQRDALRTIENQQAAAQPPLMQRAGAAACAVALDMLAKQTPGDVLVLAGPGNNGGDAFVVARLLKAAGIPVTLAFNGSAEKLSAEARQAHDDWLATGGAVLRDFPAGRFALLIDGLFGIGLGRAIEGQAQDWIERCNASNTPVLALDIPSGLDADSGVALGATVRATRTASFIALKPGLLTGDGPDHAGEIVPCDLDLALSFATCSVLAPEMQAPGECQYAIKPAGELIGAGDFHAVLQPRRRNTHKGSFGNVAVIGGASGMAGAALLAGRAALKLGAGRVFIGMLDAMRVDPLQPELMLRPPQESLMAAEIVAIGPGLGQSVVAGEMLMHCLDSPLPLIIDADALNLLTQGTLLQRKVAVRPAPTFLTPHPAEAARLLGVDTATVQAGRIGSAVQLARRFNAHVLLKGCGSIVATPDGNWFINASGNPGLATAGSGDVLTGLLAALLAQFGASNACLRMATHLHGRAAEVCVANGIGPIGLTAGELIDAARQLLNTWITANARQALQSTV